MFDFNLGFAIRDIYMLGNGLLDLTVFDPRQILIREAQNVISYSGYASEHYKNLVRLDNEETALNYLQSYSGRLIYAVPDETNAVDVDKFQFLNEDLIVFGNEHYGIPEKAEMFADEKIIIPMYGSVYTRPDFDGQVTNVGIQRCLSLHTSISIILYLAVRCLTKHENWRESYKTPINFGDKIASSE